MKIRTLAVLALVLGLTGCYHAVIDTGKPASDVVIEDPWAMSFVAGLIPPDSVNVASRCPNGVARVETRHSFMNQLVAGLTSWIITPMTITVTCAAGNMEEPDAEEPEIIEVESPAPDALARALNDAALRSWQRLGSPVYVSITAE